jgi:enoyl-CoA hydratase/carnithine racemase
VVPAERLAAAVDGWVADILKCAPLALEATKQLAMEARDLPAWAAPNWLPRRVLEAMNSDDAREGIRAFTEKLAPQWRRR